MDDKLYGDVIEEDQSMTGGDDQALDISSDLIRGHINTIILRSLYDEDKYGYDIMDEIEKKSGSLYKLKPPTLYSALKRLEKLGYVKSYAGEFSNGGQRKYFHLTDEGRAVAKRNLSEWEFSRTIIDSLISDGENHFDFSFITEKQQELTELKRSLAAREAALEEEKSALAKLRNEIQRERSLVSVQSSSLSEQKIDLSELRDKIASQKKELEHKELMLSEKQGEIDAKELALREKEREIAKTRGQLEELSVEIDTLQEKLRTKAELLEQSQARTIEQAEELKDTENALRNLQEQYADLKTDFAALKESGVRSEEENEKLAELKAQLVKKQAEIEEKEKQLEEKDAELEKRETTLAAAQIELSEKSSEYYQLLSKIQAEQNKLEVEKSALLEREKAVETNAETKEELIRLQTALSDKDAQIAEVNALLAAQESSTRILREELDKKAQLSSETETAVEGYKREIEEAKTKLEEKDAEKAETEALVKELEEEKAELEKTVYELKTKEDELSGEIESLKATLSATTEDKQQSDRLQGELYEKQEQLRRATEQMKYDAEMLAQQQRELSARQSAFNQQQLDFITRKNALASQQFDYADKFGTYTAQAKHLNESVARFEAEKAAFFAEKEALEEKIRFLESEKENFRGEKDAHEKQRLETEKKNVDFVDALKAKEEELDRKTAALREREEALEERELAFHSARRQYFEQPAPSPQPAPTSQPYYTQTTQTPHTGSFDYDDLQRRAKSDGIRLSTAGTARSEYAYSPAPVKKRKAETRTFNKGATLFKAALVVLFFVISESIAVFFLKEYLAVPFWYPFIPLGICFLFFFVCTILYASGKSKTAKLARSPSYMITAAVLFVIGIIVTTMIAVYLKADLSVPSKMLAFVIVPVVYLFNIFLFSLFYYFFSKTTSENGDE